MTTKQTTENSTPVATVRSGNATIETTFRDTGSAVEAVKGMKVGTKLSGPKSKIARAALNQFANDADKADLNVTAMQVLLISSDDSLADSLVSNAGRRSSIRLAIAALVKGKVTDPFDPRVRVAVAVAKSRAAELRAAVDSDKVSAKDMAATLSAVVDAVEKGGSQGSAIAGVLPRAQDETTPDERLFIRAGELIGSLDEILSDENLSDASRASLLASLADMAAGKPAGTVVTV